MSLVLLATNGSAACDRAAVRATGLFGDVDFVVTMVVTGERVPAGGRWQTGSTVRAAADELAVAVALDVVSQARDTLGPRARSVVLNGDPVTAISDLAHVEGAEAIVVGSLGGGSLPKVLRGSIARDLLAMAPCSVVELGR